jgi:hypothetical protein
LVREDTSTVPSRPIGDCIAPLGLVIRAQVKGVDLANSRQFGDVVLQQSMNWR